MDFIQLLEALKVDAPTLLYRFSGNESLAKRFLLKFPADKTFSSLEAVVTANDIPGIQNASHALKGIALNLGLDRIGNPSSELCEDLRANREDRIGELFSIISTEYHSAVELIEQFNKQ